MITVNVELKTGTTTRRLTVSAPTIEMAIEIASSFASEAGADSSARVLFPIDGEAFFAPVGNPAGGIDYAAMNREEIESAYEAHPPGCLRGLDRPPQGRPRRGGLRGVRPRERPRLILRPTAPPADPARGPRSQTEETGGSTTSEPASPRAPGHPGGGRLPALESVRRENPHLQNQTGERRRP